jgi:predicted ATPase
MLEQMLKLAEELGRKAESSHALNGLSLVHLNRGELTQARAHAIEALTRAVEAGERACELLARRTIGTVKFLLGELPDARAELHNCLDLYTPEHDRTLIRYYSFDPFVASHGFLSWSYWILGYPDSARQHLRAGHTYASELQHGYSLIFSHLMAAVLYLMLREPGPSQVHAEAAISLSAEQRLPYFSSIAKACQGWAQARGGHVASGLSRLREGLEAHQAVPWEPLMHCSMAEILVAARRADEALACLAGADLIVEQTGASWWAAEIQRTRGVALLSLPMPDAARAASSFEAALERARSQQAMSWELRASASLARLWGEQGRRAEAQDLLARVYGWFTEGFDTADLKEARALLDELA